MIGNANLVNKFFTKIHQPKLRGAPKLLVVHGNIEKEGGREISKLWSHPLFQNSRLSLIAEDDDFPHGMRLPALQEKSEDGFLERALLSAKSKGIEHFGPGEERVVLVGGLIRCCLLSSFDDIMGLKLAQGGNAEFHLPLDAIRKGDLQYKMGFVTGSTPDTLSYIDFLEIERKRNNNVGYSVFYNNEMVLLKGDISRITLRWYDTVERMLAYLALE